MAIHGPYAVISISGTSRSTVAVRDDRSVELEPIDPETAVELYLADREPEPASVTLSSHRLRLGFFVEWRLDVAIHLRGEIKRLEEVETELLERTTTASTDFEERIVEGALTRDGQVILAEENDYSLIIPVPSEYEEITEYGPDLERIQTEKRQHIDQIITLLGLDDRDGDRRQQRPSGGSDTKPVQFREADDEGDAGTSGREFRRAKPARNRWIRSIRDLCVESVTRSRNSGGVTRKGTGPGSRQ